MPAQALTRLRAGLSCVCVCVCVAGVFLKAVIGDTKRHASQTCRLFLTPGGPLDHGQALQTDTATAATVLQEPRLCMNSKTSKKYSGSVSARAQAHTQPVLGE